MRILLVDDHAVVREGVRELLSALPAACVLEASNGEDALVSYRAQRPNIVILDLRLQQGCTGTEVLSRLIALDSDARIIVFSFIADATIVARVLRLGARGFVSKAAGADELLSAVRSVAQGHSYIEKDVARQLAFAADLTDPLLDLTRREAQILDLLGAGSSLSEIAVAMGVASKTVANSVSILKQKLGVERTAELIRLALSLKN